MFGWGGPTRCGGDGETLAEQGSVLSDASPLRCNRDGNDHLTALRAGKWSC